MKRQRPWEVGRTGPLVQVDDGLWCVEDTVPNIPGARRRMSIIRRADGGLVFYNAVPLTDAQLDEVRGFGLPAQLIAPSPLHMLHAHAFAQKLGVPVFGPTKSLAEVRQRVPAASGHRDFPSDPSIELAAVDGFVTGEVALLLTRGGRLSLIVCDVLTNQRHARGFFGTVMRLMDFSGPAPKLPKPVRKRVLRDAKAVAALLEGWAARPGLARLVPSHGEVQVDDVPGALRAVAATL